ncbi:unnamed protein product [Callosobruchus maculatus]|uniref:Uncharacterized protein n=1 Tax=Callosobruchus maculatus TaxID=64391 RepID=A0A653CIQ6_CALMS|nr:unnamed protein product [Callosobruchus maculatus]
MFPLEIPILPRFITGGISSLNFSLESGKTYEAAGAGQLLTQVVISADCDTLKLYPEAVSVQEQFRHNYEINKHMRSTWVLNEKCLYMFQSTNQDSEERSGYSTDEAKRKGEDEADIFKKCKKISRSPAKGVKRSVSEMDELKEMMAGIMSELREIRKENIEFKEEIMQMK